jgi:peptide chain release factor subunit 1
MIRKREIEELLEKRSEEHPVISIYLNIVPPRQFTTELNSLLHTELRKVREGGDYSADELKELEKLAERIERHVRERSNRFEATRLIAVFADTRGFWREYELPVSHPSRVAIEPTPYTRPLAALQDQFNQYCVLVTDSYKARIFTLTADKFVEHEGFFTEDEIQHSRDESLQGLGRERQQRYVQDHANRHMKNIAYRLYHFFRNGGFDRLIIGGPRDKELPLLRGHLHSSLKERLTGEIHVRPEESDQKIKERAREAADQWRIQHEKSLIDTMREENHSRGSAVVGLRGVLKALHYGQVHTLILQRDFNYPGYLCPRDHYLVLEGGSCPVCGTELQKADDIVDEVVEETISQNGEVRHLYHHEDALGEEGIAALLRFVM